MVHDIAQLTVEEMTGIGFSLGHAQLVFANLNGGHNGPGGTSPGTPMSMGASMTGSGGGESVSAAVMSAVGTVVSQAVQDMGAVLQESAKVTVDSKRNCSDLPELKGEDPTMREVVEWLTGVKKKRPTAADGQVAAFLENVIEDQGAN